MGVDLTDILRLSVRALVEFTLHGDDIRPGGSLKDCLEGQLGHKARQKMLGDGWQAEVPLDLTCEGDDDWEVRVSGRMDGYLDAEIPVIEEIKLCSAKWTPQEVTEAHWAQAVCYGYMLSPEDETKRILIRVAYVTRDGTVRAKFEQEMTAGECGRLFLELLQNWIRRQRILRKHRRERDASLQHLEFPFSGWRPGQREMAAQVYTAIQRRRRLFACMPTGCGKSAATLFPALKALGNGMTGQVYYLTARTTQRQGPSEAIAMMRQQPLHLWTLTLDAKDRQCPEEHICHPDWCPRAKGHYLRDAEAIEEMLGTEDWSPEAIRAMADKYQLCPFEFALSLVEVADLVICDYNYALDPAVHIRRIFDRPGEVTLLVDEAHHLDDRVREMLGGTVDTGRIRRLRTVVGKAEGRGHRLYKAMTEVIRQGEALPAEERQTEIPKELFFAAEELAMGLLEEKMGSFPWNDAGEKITDALTELLGFVRAGKRDPQEYAYLRQGNKQCRLTAFPLRVDHYLRETTAPMTGMVCFSATLEPLHEMKTLLGGEEEDACFAMPSPFPPENLLVIRENVNTRYTAREDSLPVITARIRQLQEIRPGHYIVFFPSFSYMNAAAEALDPEIPVRVQRRSMSPEEREEFLSAYRDDPSPLTSLCVMGGIFSEGIDLPGAALDGVMIVGVGLPQVNLFQETLKQSYDETLGNGFHYAYRIPGMQKVAQAAGRVIRTETDRGIVLLLDDRYGQPDYARLCPAHWRVLYGNAEERMRRFWNKTDE